MESIIKNVRDISLSDKLALEHVSGRQLAENQQAIILICSLDLQNEPAVTETESAHGLPDWCNVYAGLTDRQVAEIEQVVLQRDLTRSSNQAIRGLRYALVWLSISQNSNEDYVRNDFDTKL